MECSKEHDGGHSYRGAVVARAPFSRSMVASAIFRWRRCKDGHTRPHASATTATLFLSSFRVPCLDFLHLVPVRDSSTRVFVGEQAWSALLLNASSLEGNLSSSFIHPFPFAEGSRSLPEIRPAHCAPRCVPRISDNLGFPFIVYIRFSPLGREI